MKFNEQELHQLMMAGLRGDQSEYHLLLKKLTLLLRNYFRLRLLWAPDEVEDLVQETLLAVHCRRHTYAPDQPVTAWVYGIAHHKLVDLLRRRRIREELQTPIDEQAELSIEPGTHAVDARRDIGKLMARLPDSQRLPLQCMKLEELSVLETAERIGMSESAVKVGVHRAIKALGRMAQAAEAWPARRGPWKALQPAPGRA